MKKILESAYYDVVSLTEAKNYLKVDVSTDDTLISSIIKASQSHVEGLINNYLVATKIREYFDGFPHEINLSTAPLREIIQIQYKDGDGNTQTLSASNYEIDIASPCGRITPSYGASFPTTRGVINDVWVDYWVGFLNPVIDFSGANDRVILQHNGYAANDSVLFTNSGGGLDSALIEDVTYYVTAATDSSATAFSEGYITIEDSTGASIDLQADDTGNSFEGVIPDDIKTALRGFICEMYDRRGDMPSKFPSYLERMVYKHKLYV